MFETLKEYKQKFGNCLVPKRCKDNPKLGTCKWPESYDGHRVSVSARQTDFS